MKLIILGWKCALFVLVLNFIHIISGQHCLNYETCARCIGNQYSCVWCPAEQHTGPRCLSKKSYEGNKTWCNITVINPQTEQDIDKAKDLVSNEKGNSETVQLKPQHMKLKLRVGEETRFEMFYKPAKDYPLDLYYLMDNSYTMSFHKNKLAEQADKIYNSLVNLTNNVQFGMGSFVDKFTLPFADPFKESKAYSFKNHHSLSTNIEKFGQVVKNVESVGNLDDLEGGLDALMQVMLCKDEINWRDEARRMVILSTDNSYHSAGDGKVGGAYKHNPMECLLENGSYPTKYSLRYDYPSVSQINKVAKDKDITIIFAVLKEVKDAYVALARQIESAKHVELSKDSNIVDLITTEYLKLAQDLKISIDSSLPPHVELTMDPPCSATDPCRVKHGEQKQINVTLSVTECSANNKFTIKLGPLGLRERLEIDVDVQCGCSCEKDTVMKSPICNKFGDYQCGTCNCDKRRFGTVCECEGDLTIKTAVEKCKLKRNDSDVCSGRGNCSCGICTCDTGFSGPLCQYSDHDCPYVSGRVCAGRGHCAGPNVCKCDAGWSGPDCSCTLDKKSCYAPRSNLECSGNGDCVCGQCQCQTGDHKYTGTFCEYCEGCVEARCVELSGFAQCLHDAPATNDTQVDDCKHKFNISYNYNVEVLNRTEINAPKWRDAHRCKVQVDEQFIVFKFIDKEDSTTLLIQKEKEEPPKANVWVAVGISIGTILLIGLLTAIIWKILVDIHDAKEYEKFAKQAAAEGFEVANNPLYQSPAVKFENPTYKRWSIRLSK